MEMSNLWKRIAKHHEALAAVSKIERYRKEARMAEKVNKNGPND